MTTVQEPPNGHSSPSFFKSVISKLRPQPDSDAPAPAANVYHLPQKGHQQDALFAGDKDELHGAKKSSPREREVEPDPGAGPVLPELEALCADLTTATNINRALAQTFLLLAKGRISRRDAVAFGYLSQLLLQTLPAIRREFIDAFGSSVYDAKLRSKLDLTIPSGSSSRPAAKGYQQDAFSPLNKV